MGICATVVHILALAAFEYTMLSKKSEETLIANGIIIRIRADGIYDLCKKPNIQGNSIPNWTSYPLQLLDENENVIEEIHSDCPKITIVYKNGIYRLLHWDWEPGPGPGDFDLEFKAESEAMEFIQTYYFGQNDFFDKRLEYELRKQSANKT